MKKIITSAAVAAALTSVAFAAGSFSDGNMGMTFNKNYMSDVQKDINTSIADINYTTSAAITKDSKITITLNGDASFQGEASEWKFVKVAPATKGEATGLSFTDSTTKKELKLQVTEDMNTTGAYQLKYGTTGAAYLTLEKTAADDVKVSLVAETFVGGSTEKIDGASFADATLFDAVDNNIVLKVGTCTKKAVNKDRDDFTVDSNATCDLKYTAYTMADVDYNLTDANLTVTVSGMDFADGNVTKFPATLNTSLTQIIPNATAGTQVFKVKELDTTRDFHGVFELENDAKDLATNTLKVNADLYYNSSTVKVTGLSAKADLNKSVAKVLDNEDFIAWELTTYSADILNIRVTDDKSVQTSLKIYNKSDADAPVNIKATDKNGVEYTSTGIVTAPKNGSVFLSATAINTAVGSVIPNGYSLQVSMDIDADKGDIVAFQKDADGKTPLRVSDNNGQSKGQ